MVETIMRIGLEDLTTLRLVCGHCSTASEVAIKRLGHEQPERSRGMRCPGCGGEIRKAGNDQRFPPEDALDELAKAWDSIAKLTNLRLEFVVRGCNAIGAAATQLGGGRE